MRFIVNPFTGDLVPYTNFAAKPINTNFDYSTQSPYLLHTTKGNSRILKIIVDIDTAFNGSGWSFSIGDSNNNQSLFAPFEIDLSEIEKFEVNPGYLYTISTQIYLYLNAGNATTGSGFIYLQEA